MKFLNALMAATCLAGSVASAQTAPPASDDQGAGLPEMLTQVPELRAIDDIAGMGAWASPMTNMVFMYDAENEAVIAGFPFDLDGRSLHPLLAEEEGANFAAFLAEFFGPTIEIPEEYAPTIEERLAKMSEAQRKASVDGLIMALRDVEGEADFNAAIEEWLSGLGELEIDALDDVPETEAAPAEASADTLPVDAPLAEDTAPADALPAGAPTQAPADKEATAAGDEEAADASVDDAETEKKLTLIEALPNSFYLQVGEADAPLIYLITDPACAPCQLTNDVLRDQVEAGELQLRVVMLDMVSPDSLGTIAGIVKAENSAAAYLAISGESEAPLPFARAADLPEVVMTGLKNNYAMAEAFAVPKLPFVAYEGPEGPAYIAGVPSLEQISGALAPKAPKEPETDSAD